MVGMPCDVAKNKTHQVGKEESEREGGGKIHFVFSSGEYHCISLSSDYNSFNPVWFTKFEFDINNPDCALLRFVVQDLDVFGDPIDLGQAVIPVPSLKTGYRSVILRNAYSEELELASLLVHLEFQKVFF